MSKSENNTDNDFMDVETEPEYQDENEEGMEDFIESETTVKEESEGEKTVILSEQIAQKLINRPVDITQDLETFDESSVFVEDNLKTFDDQGLEDNVKERETFDGIYENITEAETSDDETSDGIGEELETLDENYVEITNTFNKENFDLSRNVQISDRELEQDLNMDEEKNNTIEGVEKRKRDLDVEREKKKKRH